jgi:hypothetical protein
LNVSLFRAVGPMFQSFKVSKVQRFKVLPLKP